MSFNTLFQGAMPPLPDAMMIDGTGARLPAIPAPPMPPARISTDRMGREPVVDGPWIGCSELAGAVEIHDPRLLCRGREAFCRTLVEAAVARFGADRAEVSLETMTCRLEFGPGRFDRAEMARRVASAVAAATPAVRDGAGRRDDAEAGGNRLSACLFEDGDWISAVRVAESDGSISEDDGTESPVRRRRLKHMAMAGGSFTMAVAAIILPGLPTLPFLILTGRHAALVSPRIERLLRRHPWCAAILAEAEATSGSTIDGRSLAKMLGLAVLCAAGIWLLRPTLPVILVLEFALMAFLACRQWLESRHADAGLVAAA